MKKIPNIYLIVGIIANLLLALLFVLFFTSAIPREKDLKIFTEMQVPQIENTDLEKALEGMKKTEALPIIIDPTELGKVNPYR